MTTTTNPEIARTILRQIGGNMALTMIGAKNLVDTGEGVSMKIGRNAKRVTHITIRLTADDLYVVDFIRVGRAPKFTTDLVANFSGVYAEMLRELIESNTGMYLSL